MKLTVLQKDLLHAVSLASRFTSQRAQLPLLGNIMLSTEKNKLRFASTNLESSVSLTIGADIENEGTITIPSKTLADFISHLPSEKVILETKKDGLHITCGGYSSSIKGISSDDFPEIPHTVPSNSLSIPQKELVVAFQRVLFAASQDETRPLLTGVLLAFEKEGITLVATDGFRLSRMFVNVSIPQTDETTVIVPKGIISELIRIGDKDVFLCSYDEEANQIIFGAGDIVFASRIIQGEYPNYKKIIPDTDLYAVSVDREDFGRAVKAAGVFARDSSDVLHLTVSKDSLELKSESKQSGNQAVHLDAKIDTKEKKPLTVAFNYRFLNDCIGIVKSEEVVVKLINNESPGVFLDPTDKNYLHLIMPVKL